MGPISSWAEILVKIDSREAGAWWRRSRELFSHALLLALPRGRLPLNNRNRPSFHFGSRLLPNVSLAMYAVA